MIQHVWSLLCYGSVTDQETNNLSVFNIIEQLKINAEPKPEGHVNIQLELISLWIRADPSVPSKGRERLVYIFPDGEKKPLGELSIDLTSAERSRNHTRIQGLPVSQSGRYIFQVELMNDENTEWIPAAWVPLTVEFTPQKQEEMEVVT